MKSRLEETRRAPNGAAGCAIAAIVVLFAAEGIANGGNNSDTDMFHLTDVSGYVELGFFTDLNERSRSSSRNSNLERIEFSETLDIDIDAYIYHPWFLSLNGGLNVETIQDVGDSGSNRTLVGGDLRLDFLRQKPNSFAVFAKVVQSQIVRPFTQSYDLTDQVYGATFYRTSGWVPFTLSYAHHIQDGGIDGNLDEIDDTVDFFGQYELNERSTGRIDYGLSFEEVLG